MKNWPNIKRKYHDEVMEKMQQEFKYSNVMEIPKVSKITVNIGMGEAIQNHRLLEAAMQELGQITGQKPVITRARKSIAGFKLREGQAIGCRVTLRGNMMYEFFDRLVNVALPRVRDFRGVSPKSFDGRGNYSLGITEQLIFPEIDYEKVERIGGMTVTFTTNAKSDEEARHLLKLLGMPFRN